MRGAAAQSESYHTRCAKNMSRRMNSVCSALVPCLLVLLLKRVVLLTHRSSLGRNSASQRRSCCQAGGHLSAKHRRKHGCERSDRCSDQTTRAVTCVRASVVERCSRATSASHTSHSRSEEDPFVSCLLSHTVVDSAQSSGRYGIYPSTLLECGPCGEER